MKLLLALTFALTFAAPSLLLAGEPIVFADFEGTDYGAWKVEGTAFGAGPAQGSFPGMKPVSGFLGHGLVNSALGGDKATGRLISPEFKIAHRFIHFLIGGGGWEGKTCMNLLLDRAIVRTATGPHTKSGGGGELTPAAWDVSELIGKTAHLEIVDAATGSWGHITIDQIVFSDEPPARTPIIKPGQLAAAADRLAAKPRLPAQTGEGELLYNGIRLPAEWPPLHSLPKDHTPPPVPYLQHPPAIIPIDVGRQLFVDDFLIESTTLQRRFHYPQRYAGNPILKPETPVELNGGRLPLAAMISDGFCFDPKDRLFKLWYQGGWRDGTMLALSKDGLHWERPKLDVTPGTNRILPPREHLVRHGTGICFDPYTQDAEQRFKMLLYEDDKRKTSAYTSPDGIHWALRGVLPECGDNATMFYNPFRRKWVFSIRLYRGGRARDYREDDDFLAGAHWEKADEVPWAGVDNLDLPDPGIVALMPSPEKIREEAEMKREDYEKLLAKYRSDYGDPTQLYNLDAIAYESLMLGVFSIHRGPQNHVCEKLKRPKICDLEFAYSRDGFHWDRPDRTPFLASTRKEGDWDRAYLHSGVGLCTIVGDKLFFYYSGWSGQSPALGSDMYAGGSTGVAFLRRDGFASMDAAEQPGLLTTRPLTFSGRRLFVNVDAPHGSLSAEILNEHGTPIEPFTKENCVPVSTDSTRQLIVWKDAPDLSSLGNRPVRIRFHLNKGALYAFWISPNDSGTSHGYVAAGGPEFTGPTDTAGRGNPPR